MYVIHVGRHLYSVMFHADGDVSIQNLTGKSMVEATLAKAIQKAYAGECVAFKVGRDQVWNATLGTMTPARLLKIIQTKGL